MKVCAYCLLESGLTKEHIWPRTLIQKYDSLITYNPRKHNFYIGEPVVKDVCATCNNTHLSKLDNYLSYLYDASFAKILAPGEDVIFSYQYDLLLRSLLKISYNSSRAFREKSDISVLSDFSEYILHGGNSQKVIIHLQIVTASKMMNADTGEFLGDLSPINLRCGWVPYDGALCKHFLVRFVAINSFWFYLILSRKNEEDSRWNAFIDGFRMWKTPRGILVNPMSDHLHVEVNQTTYMHPALLGLLQYADKPKGFA